jgi:dihydrodipicolinate reductase
VVQSSLEAVKDDFDVLIDFTRPEGTLNHLAFCRQHGKGMVIGTTGFDDAANRRFAMLRRRLPSSCRQLQRRRQRDA